MHANAARLVLLLAVVGPAAHAQERKKAPPTPPLFTAESPVAITLTADWKRIRDDRDDKSPWRTATIKYAGDDGKPVTVPIHIKTHGIWRLKHCEFPPLRFNVNNKTAKGTLFYDLQHPKIVNVCRDNARYEDLLLAEMQLYRVYQALTPNSHRVRTLRIAYADSATGKVDATRYAFLFEDPDEMADRLGGMLMKTKGAQPSDLDPASAALAFVFEYLIANTDFSFNGLHNGELVMKYDGSGLIPVAYDFDFSGAVNAPYATVDPRMPVKRVRDRLFRGYCALRDAYPSAFARFRERKAAILALYTDDVGKLLDKDTVRLTLEYFEEFFDHIRDDDRATGSILSGCLS